MNCTDCDHLRTEAAALREALRSVESHVRAELDRGYVLSHEPGAGLIWRSRWNVILGNAETALQPSAGLDILERLRLAEAVVEASRSIRGEMNEDALDDAIAAYDAALANGGGK